MAHERGLQGMDISSPFTGAAGHARHLNRHLAAYIVVLVLAVAIPAMS